MPEAASLFVRLGARTAQFQRKMNKAASTVQRTAKKMERAGRAMTAAISAPVAIAGGSAVAAFAQFEQQLTELQKVTSETTMEQLREPLKDLSKELPQTSSELATLAADAGRFGVKGEKNILRFVEATSKMSTATDLSVEEAGQAFAKLSTLTETPVSKVENLGSSINALSNQMATSSSEIVDSMLRSSGALSSLGASNTQIVALSATLNEVSESSERAGTRLRRLAQEMMEPKKVTALSKALGMSASEFRQMRKEAPVQLIRQMVQAMNRGGKAAQLLRTELSSTSRQALVALAQNTDGLNQALSDSASHYRENTSLQREFEAAMDTLVNRAKVLWGQLKNLGIEIGARLAPAVRALMSTVGEWVTAFQKLSSRTKATVLAISALAAAIGPLLLASGKLIGALSTLAFTTLPAVASALFSVPGAVAVLVGALVGAGAYVVTRWKSVSRFFSRITTALAELFGAAGDAILSGWKVMSRNVVETIVWMMSGVIDTIRSGLQAIPDRLVPEGWERSLKGATDAMDEWVKASDEKSDKATKNLVKAGAKMEKALKQTGDEIASGMSGAWDTISSDFDGMVTSLEERWDSFVSMFEAGQAAPQGNAPGDSQSASDGERAGNSAGAHQVFNVGKMRRVTKQVNKMAKGFEKTKQKGNATKIMWRDMSTAARVSINTTQQLFGSLFSSFTRFGDEIISVKQRFKQFGRSALRILSRVVSQIASAVATAAALKGIMSIFSMGSIGGASTFGGLFSSLLGLQHGGLVMGPTLAMVGEGPRTGPSNPEVVAPLDKLKSMIVGAGSPGGQVSNGGGGPVRARYTSRGILIEHENVDASQAEGERRRGRRGRTRP